jgi:hypothetical protein
MLRARLTTVASCAHADRGGDSTAVASLFGVGTLHGCKARHRSVAVGRWRQERAALARVEQRRSSLRTSAKGCRGEARDRGTDRRGHGDDFL